MLFFIFLLGSLPLWAVTLDQAVESSLLKNETVGQSRSQLRQANERVRVARGSILPTVALTGTYLLQPELQDPLSAQFFPNEQKTAAVSLSQPLFRGLREFAGLRREDHYYEAQKQTHLVQLTQLYRSVAESYMQVLAFEQDLRNITAQQKIYETRVKDLQGRVNRGESSSTETLTAQSTAAALNAEFQIQNSKLKAARENFSYLTGLPLNADLGNGDELEAPAPLLPLATYLARIDERPDVKEQKQLAEATHEDVNIARGAHWGTADFIGNYYLLRPEGITEELKWDIQLRVTFPLYEGGTTQSRVRAASLKQGETDLGLSQMRRRSEAEIKSLYDSIVMRTDQLKYLKLSSDLSEKNFQLLSRDSRRGLVRSIDVQLGLTEYRGAKRTYDQARFEARLERIRLDLAAGYVPPILTKEL